MRQEQSDRREPRARVLFVCTGNSCRSQMAEGFLRHLAGDRYEAHSAGFAPKPVHPMAVEVMKEKGIDISGQTSKSTSEYLGKVNVATAIFVCERAEKQCPRLFPFAQEQLLWPFDDPAEAVGDDEAKRQVFRRVRDEIEAKIRQWVKMQDPSTQAEAQA